MYNSDLPGPGDDSMLSDSVLSKIDTFNDEIEVESLWYQYYSSIYQTIMENPGFYIWSLHFPVLAVFVLTWVSTLVEDTRGIPAIIRFPIIFIFGFLPPIAIVSLDFVITMWFFI